MEFLRRGREEAARRERVSASYYQIQEMLPQKDSIPAKLFRSAYLAPSIRIDAYQEDLKSINVLNELPNLKYADDIVLEFSDLSKKESRLWLRAQKTSTTFIFDNRKFKVTNSGQKDFSEVKDPNLLLENLFACVEEHLYHGRDTWAKVLKNRKQDYFKNNKIGEDKLLEEEIETLTRRADSGFFGEVVIFGKDRVNENGKEIVELYTTFDFNSRSAVYNLQQDYEYASDIETRLYDDKEGRQVFEVDRDGYSLRMKQIPQMSSEEGVDAVEKSFAEYMAGNGGFGFELEGVGKVTLLDFDTGINYPVFEEE